MVCTSCVYEGCSNGIDCKCSCHVETCEKKNKFTFYAIALPDKDKSLTTASWYRTYTPTSTECAGFVRDITDAKIWTKKAEAQSKCTAIGGSTVLVEFSVTDVTVIDQIEYRKKKNEEKCLREQKAFVKKQQDDIVAAEKAIAMAQKRLELLKQKNVSHNMNCTCKSCMGM